MHRTGTMQRGVDNLYGFGHFFNKITAVQLGFNARPVFFVYLFIDDDEFTILNCFVAVHHVNFLNRVYFVDNTLIVGGITCAPSFQ